MKGEDEINYHYEELQMVTRVLMIRSSRYFYHWVSRCYSTVSTAYLPTIYALSTPAGQKSAIAVVRISGSNAAYIYQALTKSKRNPKPRLSVLKKLYVPGTISKSSPILLDHALTLFFKSPNTFTGEDVLELYLHGGKAVTKSVLKAIGSLHNREEGINIRLADRGEFSQRAFQNGKFDLTEIEGIREIIDAETESQRRSALSSFKGENKDMFVKWRSRIISNIAQLAAIIDFGEDAEIENIDKILNNVEDNILNLKGEMNDFISKVEKSSILQSGIKLVLLGQPNAGKSSLINKISNDDISIVSQLPGTTRDAVETIIDIQGYKVNICDTAGIRNKSTDPVEILGIQKAIKKFHYCDICLLLIDPKQTPLIRNDMIELLNSPKIIRKNIIIVLNKKDLLSNEKELKDTMCSLQSKFGKEHPIIPISCLNTDGIDTLIGELTKKFQLISESSEDSDPITVSQRVKEIITNDIIFGIDQFLLNKRNDMDIVMASESLSHAADGIGKITGETVGVEEVLGVVFSSFCVGK